MMRLGQDKVIEMISSPWNRKYIEKHLHDTFNMEDNKLKLYILTSELKPSDL